MDFAKKQLLKFGWEEGRGLGRNGDGMSEPLKVKMKRDTVGVGYSRASDVSGVWWSRVFDRVASSITVENKEDCVSISTSDQDTAPGLKGHCYDNHRRSLVYRGFLPSRVTRHCHGERKEGREEEEERDCVASATVCLEDRSSSVWRVTDKVMDEELLKACEGRTAHQAARHDLRLSGKLQRMKEQDELHEKNRELHEKNRDKSKPQKRKRHHKAHSRTIPPCN